MSQKLPGINGLNVLVVDDEIVVCQSVESILKRKGFTLDTVTSVTDALRILDAGNVYSLIIADLIMPQAGGLQLLSAVQTNWPDLPVLIITGFSSISSAVEAAKLGAAGYLSKPFSPEELSSAVETILARGLSGKGQPAEDESADMINVDTRLTKEKLEESSSKANVEHRTQSDTPVAAIRPTAPADYCSLGQRSCKRFVKKGMCQLDECPIITAERKKGRAAMAAEFVSDPIDVDLPFSSAEVSSLTSHAYVAALGRSEMPVIGYWGQFAPEAHKVLVVDDEAVIVNSIRRILTRKGFIVEEAFTCRDALAQVFSNEYDLVLLDMKMPDGDGIEVMQRIKARRPELCVVIVTGYASIETAMDAIRKGASDYVSKPFTPDELHHVASRVLGDRP